MICDMCHGGIENEERRAHSLVYPSRKRTPDRFGDGDISGLFLEAAGRIPWVISFTRGKLGSWWCHLPRCFVLDLAGSEQGSGRGNTNGTIG